MHFLPDLPSPAAYVRAPSMPDQLESPHQFKSTQTVCYQPMRDLRFASYAHNQLVELQNTLDELESMGVFVRPEDVPITVEYRNPSFLVKKSNEGFRLVTAFTDVGLYSK